MIKKMVKRPVKTIVNKHKNSASEITRELFHSNEELAKGEIIINNDPNDPSIYIITSNGEVKQIAGKNQNNSSGDGDSYDDTYLKELINQLNEDLKNLRGDDITGTIREIAENVHASGVDLSEIIADINNIKISIGTVSENTNIVDMIALEASKREDNINNLQTQINSIENNYATNQKLDDAKTELQGDIINTTNTLNTLNETINVLIGDEEEIISIRSIAQDEAGAAVANVIAGAPEAFDTLKEVSEWILGGENVEGVTAVDMLTSIQQNTTAIETEIKDRTDSINDLQGQVDIIKNDYLKSTDKNELINSINDEVSNREKSVTSINNEISGIKESINSINTDITKNGEAISEITTNINGIIGDIEGINDSITNINDDITDINDNITNINETELPSLKNDISGNTESINIINNNIQELNTKVNNVVEVEFPLVKETVSGVTNDVNSINETVNTINETVNSYTDTINRITEKNAELSAVVSTFEESINLNSENINTLTEAVSYNTEHVNILIGNEDGSVAKSIEGAKSIIDSYTINNKPISESPVLDSADIKINEEYSIVHVDNNNVIPGDIFTTAFAKLESMIVKSTLAITAALNDLESRIGVPTEYDDEGNIIKESNGLFKRIEDLEK